MAENEQAKPTEPPVDYNGVPLDELSVRLTKPIEAHGEKLTIIKWREPTAGDIERAGNPIVIEFLGLESPRVSFDEKKMSAMISHLAQLPPSSVKTLSANDWNTIAWRLFRFFMPMGG